ncbi:MAG: 23S rRNA (adenine(2503)-C(2))-methyltransferase RlmN [Candidatus Omnitrophica bacterium]|nr:23S rRNA (adenine(2503)-C(2))-methyltransferase RlmN [Candidatus Omnitrophota bacterium]
MEKIDIKNLSEVELEDSLIKVGAQSYRTRQIFGWLYRVGAGSFDDMSDIPLGLRESLKAKFHISRLVLLDTKRSKIDGTEKYLFKLRDGNTVETVFLPEAKRRTACLSSQVGCKYACSFCASAPLGFIRNLSASEILDQVLFIKVRERASPLTNIVFMGIGEPLDNYDNVMKAVRILNDKDAFGIGARRITISTCGIIPGIERLKEEDLQIELSVSLHSALESIRSRLVPVNKIYPLKDLINACKDYIKKTNRIITFEYVLIKDVNSSIEDAVRLARLLKGIKCKVNTLIYNQITVKRYKSPSEQEARAFVKALKKEGYSATHRQSKGEDIDAGCGQLRISRL